MAGGRHERAPGRQAAAGRLAAAGVALLAGAVLTLGGGELAVHGYPLFVFRAGGTGATGGTATAPASPSPRPEAVGVIVPALQHHRLVRVTVSVWAGETIIIFPATPRPGP